MINDWVEIGSIVAPQGLRGEMRVLSASDFPERFEKAGKRGLQSPNGGEIREIELLRGRYIPGRNLYIVELSGIEDRESAKTLRGYKLLANKNERPYLSADEYHVSDLVNLEVYHHLTGENIGRVTDILWAGNDLLEVHLHGQSPREAEPINSPEPHPDSRKKQKSKPKSTALPTVLIPFVKEIVPLVDLDRKRIEIDPPTGLLEINAP